jgi:hypothetical protein
MRDMQRDRCALEKTSGTGLSDQDTGSGTLQFVRFTHQDSGNFGRQQLSIPQGGFEGVISDRNNETSILQQLLCYFWIINH